MARNVQELRAARTAFIQFLLCQPCFFHNCKQFQICSGIGGCSGSAVCSVGG
jgi:hypothetical protein